ncbi:MAG: hypothetical protein DMD63_10280 [Gemmatimonadetes bacterium]|nr:MAG: hypothetical protein DMD63_10280 [Gemmatimonadota bacterium]
MFERDQRVPPYGDPPLNRTTDIGTKQVPIDANHGVRQRGNRQATERRPHHWRRWDVSPSKLGIRRSQRVADQNCSSGTEPPAKEEIQTGTVGRGSAN